MPRWAGAGPLVIAMALGLRALVVRDDIAGILVAIAGSLGVIGVVIAVRRPSIPAGVAAVLLLIGPVALVTSPSRTELSFNLARPGDAGWFALTIVLGIGSGIAIGGVADAGWSWLNGRRHAAARRTVARRRATPSRVAAVGLTVVGAGAAVLGLIALIDPQPDLGRSLSAEERAGLPTVGLYDFVFVPTTVDVTDGRLRARLDNPTGLPHTFTVDSLGIDVHVPARRSTFVDVAVPPGALDGEGARVWCSIGDHLELGMVGTLELRS